MNGFTDKDVDDFIKGVFDGSITEYDLSADFYFAVADHLKKGLFEGFGGSLEDFTGKDLDLLEQLRINIYNFAAAKSYQFTKEMRSLILDDAGEKRSLKDYLDIGSKTFADWNDTWGATEYVTCEGQAQSASKWQQIEKNKDILPILRFSTKGNPCEECLPYEDFTAPVDDPVWDWLMPLLHFLCGCTVEQEEEGTPIIEGDDYDKVIDSKDKIPEMFRSNPGKTGEVFDGSHPYFDVPKKDESYAKRNFDLPLPSNDK